MIQLCYVNQIHSTSSFLSFLYSNLLMNMEPENNFIIVPSTDFYDESIRCLNCMSQSSSLTENQRTHIREWLDRDPIRESETVDIECIYGKSLKNILLINFDSMDLSILQSLIHKSKKTEIIGISIDHTEYFKTLQLEIKKYKDKGFTLDQIIVMIVLKYNCPSTMVKECLNNIRFTDSNIEIKTIDSMFDLVKMIK